MSNTPRRERSPFERCAKINRSPVKRKEISPILENEEKRKKNLDEIKRDKGMEKKIEDLKKGEDLNEKLNFLLDLESERKAERRALNKNFEDLFDLMLREKEERKAETEKLKEEINNMKNEMRKYQEKLEELENRGRRTNLVFKGIEEKKEESWIETEEMLMSVFEKHFQYKPKALGQAQRVGQYRQNSKYPRVILARFEKESERKMILDSKFKLKNTNIYVEEDFSKEVRDIRRVLWKEAVEERKKGKRATVRYKTLIVDGEEFKWNKEKKQLEKIENKYNNYQKNLIGKRGD